MEQGNLLSKIAQVHTRTVKEQFAPEENRDMASLPCNQRGQH